MPGEVAETAIFEVLVGDRWVEWNRLERSLGQQWEGTILIMMRPRTRVRFVDNHGGERTEAG